MDARRRQRVGGVPAGVLVVALCVLSATPWPPHGQARIKPVLAGTQAAPAPQCTTLQTHLPRPCGILAGIAALSHADIWAVGANTNVTPQRPLIEHWDGLFWHVVSDAPAPTGQLTAVAAISHTDVWAVGAGGLIEHYDGRHWAIVPGPASGDLSGVAAIAPHDVWAVGQDHVSRPLLVYWNGARWSIVPGPRGPSVNGALLGVAAVSAHNVWAVGSGSRAGHDQTPLVIHWDGTVWRETPIPHIGRPGAANSLASITAVSAHDIWAVGSYDASNCCRAGAGPIALHYDGWRWQSVPIPNIPGSAQHNIAGVELTGVSALSSGDVWAVGMTASEHWDGTSWRIVPSPHGRLSTGATLVAVAAIATRDVWAVGDILAETALAHWNGVRWGLAPSPSTNI